MAIYTLNQLKQISQTKTEDELIEIVLPWFTAKYTKIYNDCREAINDNPKSEGLYITRLEEKERIHCYNGVNQLSRLWEEINKITEKFKRHKYLREIWWEPFEDGIEIYCSYAELEKEDRIPRTAYNKSKFFVSRLLRYPKSYSLQKDFEDISEFMK